MVIPMLQRETAGLSDIGKNRDQQEDAFLVDDEHGLYIVADGMGGHLAGEVASAIIIDTLQAAACDPCRHLPAAAETSRSLASAKLLGWIRQANRNVYQRSLSDEQCRGMGSTIAALYFTDNLVVTANVGDSPVYLVSAGGIEMLSAMHTVAAERRALALQGLDLPVHFHHMLTRAVGIDAEVEPNIRETDFRAGDAFILCSDGLSNAVEPEEMLAIVRRCSARDACARLVGLANARGGDDNSTVIVIKTNG
jgi:protein phosphatase